jgi:hypothetical protein
MSISLQNICRFYENLNQENLPEIQGFAKPSRGEELYAKLPWVGGLFRWLARKFTTPQINTAY